MFVEEDQKYSVWSRKYSGPEIFLTVFGMDQEEEEKLNPFPRKALLGEQISVFMSLAYKFLDG